MTSIKTSLCGLRRGILAAALLIGASMPAMAQDAGSALCPENPPPPPVTITIEESNLRFESDYTRHQIADIWEGRIDPAATGGLMTGEIALLHDMDFERAADPQARESCTWVTAVNVRLQFVPKVYIARDLHENSCWYQEIYRHELLHVAEDKAILEKYRTHIAQAMAMVFAHKQDFVMAGGTGKRAAQMQEEALRERIAQPLGVMFEMMMVERTGRQAAIDTPVEYGRVAERCAHEPLPPPPAAKTASAKPEKPQGKGGFWSAFWGRWFGKKDGG